MADKRPCVVVLDDEERVRELLIEFFDEYDEFDLIGAASGEEGLEALSGRHADVCVVDMRLPGIDGARFIELAAARGLCRHFVVHTGSVDFSLPQSLLDLGLVQEDVFYKPVNASDLADRVRQLLKE